MRIHLCSLILTGALLTVAQAADRRAIVPPEFAPAAGAAAPPYSPGILIDGTLYVAGQIGQDLKTKEIPSDFESEIKTCLDRVAIVLKAAGMSFQDAVTVQVYLTDIDLFARMNAVYITYFKEPRPARTAIAVVKLPAANAHIEITVTARK
jgi:2-iminobutanoate/2-iminopropanoate deaminase